MTVDSDLKVGPLAQGVGRLVGDAHRAGGLLGEAVSAKIRTPSLAGQLKHLLDALAIEVLLVPGRCGRQALELVLRSTGDARSDGVTVLVGQRGQQPVR
jgi:hypothetical protein